MASPQKPIAPVLLLLLELTFTRQSGQESSTYHHAGALELESQRATLFHGHLTLTRVLMLLIPPVVVLNTIGADVQN